MYPVTARRPVSEDSLLERADTLPGALAPPPWSASRPVIQPLRIERSPSPRHRLFEGVARVVASVIGRTKTVATWSHAMPFLRKLGTRSIVQSGALILAAAVVLANCGTARNSSSDARSHAMPITTAGLNPSSICGSDEGDYVEQSLNGDFTGCFRVPNLESSSLVVALQTYLNGTSGPRSSPTTTVAPPAPKDDDISLSLSPKTATPGATVVVTGHLSMPVAQKESFATLCWDGCGGLREQGVTVHWSSSKTFDMKLRVPETAWLVSSHRAVTVQPLTSGNYEVGVQCLTSISGCALGAAEAKTTIQLNAPKPKRCFAGQPCETMSLSTSKAMVGNKILVKGWAPLQTIIGQPFGYTLSVTPGSAKKNYPSLAFAQDLKAGGFNVVLTPKALRVEPSPTWASLGRIHYVSSTFSGSSAVEPASSSKLIAWCQPSGIEITGGPTRISVPTVGVRAALKGSTLKIFSNPASIPQCATVQLDPRYGDSVYAGFGTGQGDNIPPVYLAALYTTNAGTTWHTVPIPTGTSMEDFAGFTTEGSQTVALFSGPSSNSNRDVPSGTDNGIVPAEVTSNGGLSWTSATLGCPANGPCMRFGPYQWGNCNMSNDMQPLLLGPAGATAPSGVKWTSSSWVTSVNSCFAQQLVVSSSHELFLLDPSSQYPLLQSTDSGQTWSYIALPMITAANYGPDSVPSRNSLLLAPDGSLFAAITTPSGLDQELFRLKPLSTLWCQIPHAFGTTIASSGVVGPLRVDGTDLIWSQTIYPNSGNPTSSIHVVPLSSLRC